MPLVVGWAALGRVRTTGCDKVGQLGGTIAKKETQDTCMILPGVLIHIARFMCHSSSTLVQDFAGWQNSQAREFARPLTIQ